MRLVRWALAATMALALTTGLFPEPADASCSFVPTAKVEMGKCGGSTLAGGPGIGIFRAGIATEGYLGPRYGAAKGLKGTLLAAVLASAVKTLFDAYDVPWPNADSETARRHAKDHYNVYQIFYKDRLSGITDAYKFGITRVGASRPESQLGSCREDRRTHTVRCRWKWVRVNILGWHRARRVEGAYCARYVAAKGRRPFGMSRCL